MPGWYPALADKTALKAGALTVAGQWRSFTAFPSILGDCCNGLCRSTWELL